MAQKKIVLIRQRPAFGDALLLAPLIKAIKDKYLNSCLTVITDSTYMGGALPLIFESIPGVDRVECVSAMEWTTEGNKLIDPVLNSAGTDVPYTVRKADIIYDCNSAFMSFEREYNGDPPYGIGEFWLRHFELYEPGQTCLPNMTVSDKQREAVNDWRKSRGITKHMVGIVLRAGDPARDWDYNGLSTQIIDWLHTSGYAPVTIDPIKAPTSIYAHACVGNKLDYVAALLEQCHLVITPDTGLLHLSQAVGTRTLALWGIMRPELRMGGYDCTVVPRKSLGYCDPRDSNCRCRWKFQRWSCLKRLTLPMILEGLQKAL